MKKEFSLILLIVFALLIIGCKKKALEEAELPYDPIIPAPVKLTYKTLDYLTSISGSKTISGQQGLAWWQPMKDITGKYPGLFGEDFSFAPFFGGKDLAASRQLLSEEVKKRWKEGQLIALMWHPCPPTMGEPCAFEGNVKSKLTDVQWTELITDGTPLNNAWKARMDAIIPAMQDMKNNGVEILWRPLHEMNQAAFWWGGRPGPNGSARLYQITRDYLVKVKGMTNLIWVWNVQDFATLASDLNTYDPGSDYYDVLSLDVYWSDGTGLTAAKYNAMVAKAGKKPIGIGESDVLYTAADFTSQPKWSYFMGWRELTQQKNSNQRISDIYNATNVVTLERMPGWK
ncbi:MAG: glycoside hydrolase [Pedobacter sp.]|nr:MAG: glycoside hydrolase [Pedobacter sp.]